jgi:integrase
MYKIVYTSKKFSLNGSAIPKFPFIMQADGEPVDELNEYLLEMAVDKKRSVKKTVTPNARHIVMTLNNVNLQVREVMNSECFPYGLFYSTSARLIFFRNGLVIKGLSDEYINSILYNFCAFLWWAQKKGLCKELIGINDAARSDARYAIPVESALRKEGGRNFKLLFALKVKKPKKVFLGSPEDWDEAVLATLDEPVDADELTMAKYQRDEMIIRLIRECSLRRMEVAGLRMSEFQEELRPGQRERFIILDKTKVYSTRDFPVERDFYIEIQDYIEGSRKVIMRGKKASDALLPSLTTGGFLDPESINPILNQYGQKVKPKEGRSIGLTQRFIDLIEAGLDEQESLFIVAEEAGHSHSSKGKTLKQHYLRAKQLIKGGRVKSRSALETENARLRAENERLKG